MVGVTLTVMPPLVFAGVSPSAGAHYVYDHDDDDYVSGDDVDDSLPSDGDHDHHLHQELLDMQMHPQLWQRWKKRNKSAFRGAKEQKAGLYR